MEVGLQACVLCAGVRRSERLLACGLEHVRLRHSLDYDNPGGRRAGGHFHCPPAAHSAYAKDRLRLSHLEPRARPADSHDGFLQDDHRVGGVGGPAAAHRHVHIRHHQRPLFPQRGFPLGKHRPMPALAHFILYCTYDVIRQCFVHL